MYTLNEILPAGLVPSLLALVFMIIGFVLLILYCRLYRRQDYGEVPGDNGERNDNGHGGNQNGGGGANQNGREN